MVDPTARSPVARRVLPWLPVAAWAALIFFLSSESEPPEPAELAGLPGWSQAAHFGLYFVLGALLYFAFKGSGVRVQGTGTSSGVRVQGSGTGSGFRVQGSGTDSGFRVQGSGTDSGFRGQGSGTGSGFRGQGTGNGKLKIPSTCLLALAAGALYAATDEVHQHFVPMRQADALDWLVDVAGVLVGALVVLAWERRRGKS